MSLEEAGGASLVIVGVSSGGALGTGWDGVDVSILEITTWGPARKQRGPLGTAGDRPEGR